MSPVPEEWENDAKPHETGTVDDLPLPDVFVNVESESSDSEGDDEEQNGYLGYQMLPQGIEEDEGDLTGDSSSEEISVSQIDEAIQNSGIHVQSGGGTPSYMQVPEIPKPNAEDLLWNQSRDDFKTKLDEESAEKIKNVMKQIQLPQDNIPEWAKAIPEDKWKEKIAKIHDKKS